MKTRLSFAGLGLLAASAPLFAEIPLGENFFLSGYAVGAVTNT